MVGSNARCNASICADVNAVPRCVWTCVRSWTSCMPASKTSVPSVWLKKHGHDPTLALMNFVPADVETSPSQPDAQHVGRTLRFHETLPP